jgi:hypothetical protein
MRLVRPAFALTVLILSAPSGRTADKVDFNRDVRPILADNCFRCHGPDDKARQANLRLDNRAAATAKVIVPGKSATSEFVQRISAADEAKRMPPAASGKKLSPAQIAVLKRWVEEGAEYKGHWAFIAPTRPELPKVADEKWIRNPIDRFILAKLEREGLKPSPEADPTTLIRRVTLDLTGLPPTIAEVDEFLRAYAAKPQAAYLALVDRLLASPRYGERMALDWLDAARYADTHGYHIDSGRNMTRWREYVIDSFNANKPFDQFTIEQLAGDLLPNATLEQKIASGFNRNHMINFEGGAIPEEYQTAYIIDRINTTATVWMGLTLGCCQCHDHKFDPFTMKDFYSLYAFFNNIPERGLDGNKGNAVPFLKAPTKEQEKTLVELHSFAMALEALRAVPSAVEFGKCAQPVRAKIADIENRIPDAMVMQEMPKPRDTFMLVRGQYDKKGEKVSANTPASLPPLSAKSAANRLDLAKWLVRADHPLMARVIVNRYWQMYFGTGLVKTSEDFGSQGEWPSHPELLDWLAVEFRELGWDVKRMQKLIVMSATYRQASSVTKESLAHDPENRLLARMSRLRLQAEFIRDQALAVSSLLNGEIGGASVSPYQPKGIWEELMSRGDGDNWTAQKYVQSHGKDLYRRTMYTFWKRTAPPPSLTTLDAPDRETCVVRRSRTNTPLQALVLMNDPTYVEASRKLAERILTEGGKTSDERIVFAFKLCTARQPNEQELKILKQVLAMQLEKYQRDKAAAEKLLKVGESPRNEKIDAAELAAWAMVANTILNLDETVTRN